MSKPLPHIALIGAGPGDPELITLKALRRLEQADVVLYDALSNPQILEYAPQARKIFVGKRAGKHSFRQEDIQLLMVQSAYKFGRVVRLKGGDPFVFGRGHEELEYAKAFDIPVEVIPGITSAIAVPAAAEIPVTCRGIAESFWVVTATTKAGALSADIKHAAASSATIVILMGLRKLEQIVATFKKLGKEHTPAMVIQDGTLPNQRMVFGPLSELPSKVQEQKIGTPAIIVVGQSVSLHPEFIIQLSEKISNASR